MAEASCSQSPTDSQNEEKINLSSPPTKRVLNYITLGKTLTLENVPLSWDEHQIEEYIRKYTDGRPEHSTISATDREAIWTTQMGTLTKKKQTYLKNKFDSGEIAESIEEIILEKNEEDSTRLCLVIFRTHKMAQDVRDLIRNIKEFDPPIIPKFYRPFQEPDKSNATRSRSRSPLTTGNESVDKKKNCRVLLLSKLHTSWYKSRIESYLKDTLPEEIMNDVRYIYRLKDNQKKFIGKCVVLFASPEVCKKARIILIKSTKREGVDIWIDFDLENSCIWREDDTPDFYANNLKYKTNPEVAQKEVERFTRFAPKKKPNENKPSWNRRDKIPIHYGSSFFGDQGSDICNLTFKNDLMLTNQDQQLSETYGLSPQLLASYDIKPPLRSKIYVANLPLDYDDETKIRKLFSHAGTVLSVTIIARHDALQLKVEFDHPIEAVQAITMFKNQEVYGKRLIVQMDRRHANKRYLPDGLKAFGPGLGPSGIPLKRIRNTIELQNMKNMIMKEIENLKRQNYQGNDGNQSQTATKQPVMQNQMATLDNSLANPVQNNPLLALGALLNPQATQVLQLLSQQSSGNNLSAVLNPTQNQGITSQASGWNFNQVTDVSQNSPLNMLGRSNTQGNMQSGLNTGNMQSGLNAGNMQSGLNAANMQSGLNAGNMQSGLNAANMQSGLNAANMQSGLNAANMQSGLNAANMQSGLNAANMQSGLNAANMQSGLNAANMQSGLNAGNMQSGLNAANMQSGLKTQSASNIQSGLTALNVQGGLNSQEMHQSEPNIHGGRDQGRSYMQGGVNMGAGTNIQDGFNRNRNLDNDASCSVLFNYLPPSVNLSALKSKVNEIADIKMANMIGPGRAVVVFYHQRDADACVKLFDRTKVDGQMIDVRHL